MTTPRIRSLVSLAAGLMIAATITACAGAPARTGWDDPAAPALPVSIRFDNHARDYVHVYLVGERREWFLGRVEPGARATLRIPEEAFAEDGAAMKLAVLPGGRMTLQASAHVRTATAIAQPVTDILEQRWTFTETAARGQLTTLRIAP